MQNTYARPRVSARETAAQTKRHATCGNSSLASQRKTLVMVTMMKRVFAAKM